MQELGPKSKYFLSKGLVPIQDIQAYCDKKGRPLSLPPLQSNHILVCGFDREVEEILIYCWTLEDMQSLYNQYLNGMAVRLNWYTLPNPFRGFDIKPSEAIVLQIIEKNSPNVPLVVKETIADYAMGNSGAAYALSVQAVGFQSTEQVEKLVGWSLKKHTPERAVEIWQNLRGGL